MTEDLAAAVEGTAFGGERWFAGKGTQVEGVRLVGSLGPIDGDWLLAVSVSTDAGARDVYLLPARVEAGALAAAAGPVFVALAQACLEGRTRAGDGFRVVGSSGPATPVPRVRAARPLGVDQSNTTVVLDDRLVSKCYRRFGEGPHPEIELTRHLSGRGLACLPPVRGSGEVVLADGRRGGALLVQDYVADARDGWLAAEDELEALLGSGDAQAAADAPKAWASGVGRATAELHALLATAKTEGFEPRAATRSDAAGIRAAASAQLAEAMRIVPPDVRAELEEAAPALERLFAAFEGTPFLLTRVHGDLHIGQFLLRGGEPPALVDFEGEPTKDTAERRRHASPLRDLAGLLRSVEHAAQWMLHSRNATDTASARIASAWTAAARRAIRDAYDRGLRDHSAPFEVDDDLLAAFEAEKAVYEFVYAVRFLPSWLDVPRRALRSVIPS